MLHFLITYISFIQQFFQEVTNTSVLENDTGGDGDDSESSDASKDGSNEEDNVVASNLVSMKAGSGAAASRVRPERVTRPAQGGGGTSGIATYQIVTNPAGSNAPAGRDTGDGAPEGSDAPAASNSTPVTPINSVTTAEQLVRQLGPQRKPTGNQRSLVWQSILLLKDDDVRRLKIVSGMRATHYCFYCDTLLSLAWRSNEKGKRSNSGCYLTSGAERHLKKCEGGGKEAISLHLEKTEENQKKRKHAVQEKLEKYSNLNSPQGKCCLFQINFFYFTHYVSSYFFNR